MLPIKCFWDCWFSTSQWISIWNFRISEFWICGISVSNSTEYRNLCFASWSFLVFPPSPLLRFDTARIPWELISEDKGHQGQNLIFLWWSITSKVAPNAMDQVTIDVFVILYSLISCFWEFFDPFLFKIFNTAWDWSGLSTNQRSQTPCWLNPSKPWQFNHEDPYQLKICNSVICNL